MSITQEALDKVSAQVKASHEKAMEVADKALKEMEKHGAISASHKEEIDKTLTEVGNLSAQVSALEKQIATAKQTNARPLSVGEQVLANEKMREHIRSQSGKFAMGVRADGSGSSGSGSSGSGSGGANGITGSFTGGGVYVPTIGNAGYVPLTVRSLLASGTIGDEEFSMSFPVFKGATGGADGQGGYGKRKAETSLEIDNETVFTETIAHWIPVPLQMLRGSKSLAGFIDTQMLYLLDQKIEDRILAGSGLNGQIRGLLTVGTAYSQPTGAKVTAENEMDRLRLAILQATLGGRAVDGIVLNPVDYANIELTKDKNSNYSASSPFGGGIPTLWGVRVTQSHSMGVGDFLVGAFGTGAQLFSKSEGKLAVSFEDEDNFKRNLATIRAEEDLMLAVYAPDSFVKGDFDNFAS